MTLDAQLNMNSAFGRISRLTRDCAKFNLGRFVEKSRVDVCSKIAQKKASEKFAQFLITLPETCYLQFSCQTIDLGIEVSLGQHLEVDSEMEIIR
jgi:hypothetical protein